MEYSPFKKALKSYNSSKHRRRTSSGPSINIDVDEHHEEHPILDHNHQYSSDVILKIEGGDIENPPYNYNYRENKHESSVDFWRNDTNNAMQDQGFNNMPMHDEPPLKLIGEFLHRQKASGGEISLDMDLEMNELRHDYDFSPGQSSDNESNITFPANKEVRVSFQSPKDIISGSNVIDIRSDERKKIRPNDSSSDDDEVNPRVILSRRRSSTTMNNVELRSNNGDGNEAQVLKCTSIQSRRISNLGRLTTKSRLIDPPPELVHERRSGLIKSNQMRSGMLEKLGDNNNNDDEDDSLFGEDFPDDYKKTKFDALTLAQWISLVLISTALACTLSIKKWKTKEFRGLYLWKWELLVLVLICGRLVSGWGIRIVVFFFERNFFMRKRILYFVYGVRKAVQNCIWLGMVLIAWHCVFDHENVDVKNKFLRYVNKLMVCMLVGTLLWLVKTLMVKVLASSFHVSTFFNRIQESLFNQYVIETLSGPPLVEIKNNQEEEERTMAELWRLQNAGANLPPQFKSPEFINPTKSARGLPPKVPIKGKSFKISDNSPKNQDGAGSTVGAGSTIDKGIPMDKLHRLNHKNVSAWNMKRLINVVKNGALSTLDEQVIDANGDEAATEIRSECEAIIAARKIFRNVARPGVKFIYLEDLMRFLPDEEALKTLNVVEGSTELERISKTSLKSWVVNAFRERKALALTLNDTKTAVKKLHKMVNVIVGIIILAICLVILDIVPGKSLLYFSSQVVVVAFIFGNSLKTTFEAILFVFVMHPFDVGDRCEVDGVQMIVEEMNILTTVFLRFDNQKILYPNVTLATKPIGNYYRSPDMGDSVDFFVHMATPAEKLAIIKERITSYIENKSEHWYPSPSVVLMNLEDLNRLKLSVWIRHRINHQDMGEKFKRRALLVDEMVKIFKEIDIEYRLYPLDINIRAMPPSNSTRYPSTWTPPPGNNSPL